jgi:hypothetical protein
LTREDVSAMGSPSAASMPPRLEIPTFAAELSEEDHQVYRVLISNDLSAEQQGRVTDPPATYERQERVLAVHWHPEFVPMELIDQRIDKLFPNRQTELIIPTQHNVLMSRGAYAGVEVDCFSHSFGRKVQLLVHMAAERMADAGVFQSMLSYTFRYRASQLFEFIDSIIEPQFESRLQQAARHAGADKELVRFVQAHTGKLKCLFLANESVTPPEAVRNKLLFNYFDVLSDNYDSVLIQRSQALLRAVKKIVKTHFSPDFFYGTREVIEEVRSLGGGIVIPHPEQFWPILLADYDVDGYEVWNPQSRDYTEFLINVVNRQNKLRSRRERPLLVFMGDDCHMGEKTKEPRFQDADKAGREIGVQPAWDDLNIRKSLAVGNIDRGKVIEEYKVRIAG